MKKILIALGIVLLIVLASIGGWFYHELDSPYIPSSSNSSLNALPNPVPNSFSNINLSGCKSQVDGELYVLTRSQQDVSIKNNDVFLIPPNQNIQEAVEKVNDIYSKLGPAHKKKLEGDAIKKIFNRVTQDTLGAGLEVMKLETDLKNAILNFGRYALHAQSVKTDRSGKFMFISVPNGKYYFHSITNYADQHVVWLKEIEVNGDMKISLSNDDAMIW